MLLKRWQNKMEVFEKLLDPELYAYFKNATFYENPVFHTAHKMVDFYIEFENVIPLEIYEQIITKLQLSLHAHVKLHMHTKNSVIEMDELDRYVNYFVEKYSDVKDFRFLHPYLENDTICFSTRDESRLAALNLALPSLMEKLEDVGITQEIVCKKVEDDIEIETAKVQVNAPVVKQEPVKKQYPSSNSYKKESATTYKIADLRVGYSNVQIEGHIFDIDNRVMKSGKTLQMLYISDYDDAIVAKRFEGARCPIEEIQSVKKGMHVVLTGEVVYDSFSKCDSFMVRKLEITKEKKREDHAKVKRTEWHVHSNFSEMDGVCAIEEFIQTAYDWGMDSIGVCDHQVVQAFPMAQHKIEALVKQDPNREFKMLYGCEMLVADSKYHIVYNNDHRKLEDATFVVFDLETTGLSNTRDEIIEFGGVKIKNREEVGRLQMFINPKRTIPAHISNLTHITQNDVDRAKPIEDALDELLEFIGDSILVAHNATFDVGFMNAACRKTGRDELTNPVIDTLPLSYAMLPDDQKRFNLGSVCRHYRVSYDGEGAHRADYDADVLSQVMYNMMNQLGHEATLDTLVDMESGCEKYASKKPYERNRPYHMTVFAKNKDGLKELFELITLSHTQYLVSMGKENGQPRIIKEEISKKWDNGNLLIGSSCQNGEIFELAHTRSKKELLEAMGYYDYIELQPLECYKNLLDRGSITDVDDLKWYLQFIYDTAKEAGRMVIASSDAHYVNPNEKRLRDVYINAKAIGNARHPLYIYNKQARKATSNPNQHLLTTDEMLKAFEWMGEDVAYEVVVENTNKLKLLTEPIFPIKDKLYPPDIEGSDQKLRDICFETAHQWYGNDLPDIVEKRLTRELDSIIGHGYYVVYYISHLLVKKSNDDGYLVGSRGSVGSSFVATMSNITEVNPLTPHYVCKNCQHYEFLEGDEAKSGFDLPDKVCPVCGEIMRGDGQDIPFETFLGFEGDKVPDIDLNFSGEYQPNAHAYTKEVFGDDHVFRAGTVGTVQEKTAYGYVKGYEEEMECEPFNEAKRVDLAKGCEGVKRTTGQHPGGIVVVPLDMDVHDFTPVQYPANNPNATWKTTHFDFHQIHDNILKFDILGHVDPTVIRMLQDLTGIDPLEIPLDSKEVMSLFKDTSALGITPEDIGGCKLGALGIPEFGTDFAMQMLIDTQPKYFSDLVRIAGLSHGTDVWLGNAQELLRTGQATISTAICTRDDIMIYLIQKGLESELAFTIMEKVRKGKGLTPEWEQIMREHGVPDWYIWSCNKIQYMFPKAHAAAYVMMAWRVAYCKVFYPLAYYCAYYSIRANAFDYEKMAMGRERLEYYINDYKAKKADGTISNVEDDELKDMRIVQEMYARGYEFLPIDIYRAKATKFSIIDGKLMPSLSSIDGLGEKAADAIVFAAEDGKFLSKEDFINRTKVTKTVCDLMAELGILTGLPESNQLSLFDMVM